MNFDTIFTFSKTRIKKNSSNSAGIKKKRFAKTRNLSVSMHRPTKRKTTQKAFPTDIAIKKKNSDQPQQTKSFTEKNNILPNSSASTSHKSHSSYKRTVKIKLPKQKTNLFSKKNISIRGKASILTLKKFTFLKNKQKN